jgi:ATP:corrinoid adenosyltransferase
MTERQPKKGPDRDATRDPDEALFAELPPEHKFNRIRSKDPKRTARRERLRAIRTIDVSTGKFAVAQSYFEGLVDRADAVVEGHCLVIHGRTGAGKTHIINQLLKHPDLQPEETSEGLYRPLLKVVAPAPCTLSSLGLRILQRLNYRARKKLQENEVWDRVAANLAAQGVAILVIDEMHNVLTGRNVVEREKIAMTLKSLLVSEDNPIQLVLSGLSGVTSFIDKWKEVKRRSHFLELTPLVPVKDHSKLIKFLTGLEEKIGMRTCGFTEGDMPERFMMASRGYVGRMAYFVQEAATIALAVGDPVLKEYLGDAYRRPYAVGPKENPFLIANIRDYRPPKGKKALDKDEETLLKGTKPHAEEDDQDGDDFYD